MTHQQPLSQADKQTIIAIYNDLKTALITVDMESLDNILPDDFVAVHITGYRQSKSEWLKDISDGKMVYHGFYQTSYQFHQEGMDTVVDISQLIHANIYGTERRWHIPNHIRFKKIQNSWKLIGE